MAQPSPLLSSLQDLVAQHTATLEEENAALRKRCERLELLVDDVFGVSEEIERIRERYATDCNRLDHAKEQAVKRAKAPTKARARKSAGATPPAKARKKSAGESAAGARERRVLEDASGEKHVFLTKSTPLAAAAAAAGGASHDGASSGDDADTVPVDDKDVLGAGRDAVEARKVELEHASTRLKRGRRIGWGKATRDLDARIKGLEWLIAGYDE